VGDLSAEQKVVTGIGIVGIALPFIVIGTLTFLLLRKKRR
jgi:hypothetical protein